MTLLSTHSYRWSQNDNLTTIMSNKDNAGSTVGTYIFIHNYNKITRQSSGKQENYSW